MSNPWIAQQREQAFRIELNNPSIWIELAAMLVSEGDELQTCESLFNRISYIRSHGQKLSILQMLHSGFYGPINRGKLPTFIRLLRNNAALVEQMNTAIETAMVGSDTIQGFTDQGMPSDPNGWRQPRLSFGGNVYNDWDGGLGHVAAAAWRQWFEASALQAVLGITINGHYDDATKAAVTKFQQANPPLKVDGIAGPLTWTVIRAKSKQLTV